jgi:hypothetical protein
VFSKDARRGLARQCAEPRELLRRNEGKTLVERLEYIASLVKEAAPRGLVFGNAGVEDEVVVPAGHGERVELDRAEPTEDLEHRIESASERPRGREQVVRDEEATRDLGGHLHGHDANPVLPRSRISLARSLRRSRILVRSRAAAGCRRPDQVVRQARPPSRPGARESTSPISSSGGRSFRNAPRHRRPDPREPGDRDAGR